MSDIYALLSFILASVFLLLPLCVADTYRHLCKLLKCFSYTSVLMAVFLSQKSLAYIKKAHLQFSRILVLTVVWPCLQEKEEEDFA